MNSEIFPIMDVYSLFFIVLAAVPFVNTCCGVSVEKSMIWTVSEPRALQCLQNQLIHISLSQYNI